MLVPLDRQDRSRWDAALVAEGHGLVRWCLRRKARPGSTRLLAAVNAVRTRTTLGRRHRLAPDPRPLRPKLYATVPTPVVALNRAVAVAGVDGPAAGLAIVDDLDLDGYHPLHAARADLLRRLGRVEEAVAATTGLWTWQATRPRRAYTLQGDGPSWFVAP